MAYTNPGLAQMLDITSEQMNELRRMGKESQSELRRQTESLMTQDVSNQWERFWGAANTAAP